MVELLEMISKNIFEMSALAEVRAFLLIIGRPQWLALPTMLSQVKTQLADTGFYIERT